MSEDLVARAARGDQAAKARLYYEYAPRLERYVVPKLPAEVRAAWSVADVASEVLIRAFSTLEKDGFEQNGEDAFEKWLFRIARNYVLDLINKGGKNKPRRVTKPADVSGTIGTMLGILPGDEKSPTSVMKQRDWEGALDAAIATLPDNYRTVVMLRHYEELPWDEIAQRMGSTVEGVRGLAKRANAKIKETMGSLSQYITQV